MKKPQLTIVATTRDSLSVKSPRGKGMPNLRKSISPAHLTSNTRRDADGTVTVNISPMSWDAVVADLRRHYCVSDPCNKLPATNSRLGRPPKDRSDYTGHVTHDLLRRANQLLFERHGVVMQCKETGAKALLLGIIPTEKELCPVGMVECTESLRPFCSFSELRAMIVSSAEDRPAQQRRYAGWRMYNLELEDRTEVFYKLGTSCIDKTKYMEMAQGYVELPTDVELFSSIPVRGVFVRAYVKRALGGTTVTLASQTNRTGGSCTVRLKQCRWPVYTGTIQRSSFENHAALCSVVSTTCC